MANLKCPLCGRSVNLATFNPSNYDLDFCCVEVKGLGRGKGFEVTSRYSILYPGNPTLELIKGLLLELTNLLIEHDCLKKPEVLMT